MRRVKRRTFSGVVLEQEIYNVAEEGTPANARKRLRFANDEERRKHRDGIARRHHVRLANSNWSPEWIYSTLTFDNAHEVHTFVEAKRVRDNYVRRLLRINGEAKIFIYLGKGKTTQRIHAHMVSYGLKPEEITGAWKQGTIKRMEYLRSHNYDESGIDHGQDYTGLANYLYEHWTQEQGGHRYKTTRNLIQCDREDAAECNKTYSEEHPPKAPKGYALFEVYTTTYGYQYYKYIKIPEKPGRNKNKSERIIEVQDEWYKDD